MERILKATVQRRRIIKNSQFILCTLCAPVQIHNAQTNGNGILTIFTLWTRWTWFDLTHITIVLPLCRTFLRSRFKVLPAVYFAQMRLLIFIRIIKMLIWPRLILTNCCYIDFIQSTELIYTAMEFIYWWILIFWETFFMAWAENRENISATIKTGVQKSEE